MKESYTICQLTEDEWAIAGDYHDNCSTEQLRGFLDNREELDRLNAHRDTSWTQAQLNNVLNAAIYLREHPDA